MNEVYAERIARLKSSGAVQRIVQLFSEIPDGFWIGSILCLWLLSWIDRMIWLLIAFLVVCLWILYRFRLMKCLLIWAVMGVIPVIALWNMQTLSVQIPEDGEYVVEEIRSGYAIAKRGKTRVILYEKDDLTMGDWVELSQLEPIHSLKNSGLFSFESYAHSKKVWYFADSVRLADSGKQHSFLSAPFPKIKGKIYRWISTRAGSSLYLQLFYGISQDETLEWIGSLGLPLMGLLSVARKFFRRWMVRKKADCILLGFVLLLLILFPVTVALVRIVCFTLMRLLSESRPKRLSFSALMILLIMPEAARSMSFVLPCAIVLFSMFQKGSSRRRFIQICVCAICQMIFMGKVSLVLLLLFSTFRTLLGWVFLVSLPGLMVEGYGLWLAELLAGISVPESLLEIAGMAPFWYFLLLVIWLCSFSWRFTKVKMLAGILLLAAYPFIWKLDPFFHVYLLDVGQGDSTVIVTPFKKEVIMIDAAGRFNHDNARELFLPFFKSRQIDHLDALILSHGDFDHDGAAESLLEQIRVQNCIRSSDQKLDTDFPFELLLPEREAITEDENDQSLICFFACDGFRYLWTGDASMRIEKQLIEQYELKADILKLGHHGSDTSSCDEFLEEVSCRLALISAGYQNRYGHPKAEVLTRLDELGIDRLNTADHGMIHMMSFHSLMIVESADGLLTLICP